MPALLRGEQPLAVTVGSSVCEALSRNSSSIVCRLPPGCGTVNVTVFTPLQESSSNLFLTYDGPVVSRVVTPGGRAIDGGFLVEVMGKVRAGWRLVRNPLVWSRNAVGRWGEIPLRCILGPAGTRVPWHPVPVNLCGPLCHALNKPDRLTCAVLPHNPPPPPPFPTLALTRTSAAAA